MLFEATAILQESKEGMVRIHRIVRDLGSFSHADDDATAPDQRQRGHRIGADHAAQRAQVPGARRARPARDLGGARQLGAPRPGVPEPDPERRPGARRGRHQAQRGHGAQLRRRPRRRRRGRRQRPRHPAEVMPRIFESFFTTKPRGIGTGPGPAHLAGHRALAGRRDHRRQPARRRARPFACACRPRGRAGGQRRAGRRRCRRAATRGAACSRSTTRRCCSRPIGACWATCTTSRRRSAAPRGAARRSGATRQLRRRSCATCRCPRSRAMELLRGRARALSGAGRALRLRDRRRLLDRRQAFPRGVGLRGASKSRSGSRSCCR